MVTEDREYGGPSAFEPGTEAEEATSTEQPAGGNGRKICFVQNDDGTYDVYEEDYQRPSPEEYPNGIFGLRTPKEGMKGIVALLRERDGGAARSVDDAMMKAFNESDEEQPNTEEKV